ncbi:MAG: hypothetical protein KY475_24635 [Planctomycetes bacterium]|nr:hypothetical protein [Planctomycetota bacterium]
MMSDRERWIVYPLLVFSLALGVKERFDASQGTSKFNTLVCRALVVENELGQTQAVIQENARGAAELSLAGKDNLVEASLTADDGGGRLMLMRRKDQKAILLGHDELRELTALWALDQGDAAEPIPLLIDTGDDDAWNLLAWPIEEESPQDAEQDSGDSASSPSEDE